MISFIVIGRNEGWKLSKCLDSIIEFVRYNGLDNYEIVYVDSNSTDNSLDVAKDYHMVKLFRIYGDINAAIARNVGAENSTGDILFFIDGDMELVKSFFPLVYKDKKLVRNFVSGNWINYNYDQNDTLLYKEKYIKGDSDLWESTTGGLFIIKREIWNLVGGMNAAFKKSQDTDLGLRLAKKNVLLLRKKEILAKHHTIEYLDEKRMWQDLFNWNHLYGRSLLYRKHLFNKHVYPRIVRNDYSMIFLIICIAGIFLFNKISLLLFSFYIIIIASRSKFNLNRTVYFFLRDVTVFIGLFTFFPGNNKYSIERIQ